MRWTFFKKSTLTVCGSIGPENLSHNRIRSDRRTDVSRRSSWQHFCENVTVLVGVKYHDDNNKHDTTARIRTIPEFTNSLVLF